MLHSAGGNGAGKVSDLRFSEVYDVEVDYNRPTAELAIDYHLRIATESVFDAVSHSHDRHGNVKQPKKKFIRMASVMYEPDGDLDGGLENMVIHNHLWQARMRPATLHELISWYAMDRTSNLFYHDAEESGLIALGDTFEQDGDDEVYAPVIYAFGWQQLCDEETAEEIEGAIMQGESCAMALLKRAIVPSIDIYGTSGKQWGEFAEFAVVLM
ncbi:MAG: hypothetical protein WDZ82_02860 [Candidatus Paceibacterota bacterium]